MAVATAMKSQSTESLVIPKLGIRQMKIRLVGTSPLMVHAWSEKARDMMLAKQTKQATAGKAAKVPFEDYVDSLYWMTDKPKKVEQKDIAKATFGFPAIGFKAAAVTACTSLADITKVAARQAFHVHGHNESDLVKIEGTPEMAEHMVRVGMGTADIRFRGVFKKWAVVLNVMYNERALSAEQIVNLFNTAGFAVGVGEWRPERDGSYGMFQVATE